MSLPLSPSLCLSLPLARQLPWAACGAPPPMACGRYARSRRSVAVVDNYAGIIPPPLPPLPPLPGPPPSPLLQPSAGSRFSVLHNWQETYSTAAAVPALPALSLSDVLLKTMGILRVSTLSAFPLPVRPATCPPPPPPRTVPTGRVCLWAASSHGPMPLPSSSWTAPREVSHYRSPTGEVLVLPL